MKENMECFCARFCAKSYIYPLKIKVNIYHQLKDKYMLHLLVKIIQNSELFVTKNPHFNLKVYP